MIGKRTALRVKRYYGDAGRVRPPVRAVILPQMPAADADAEVASLRLTDAEREILREVRGVYAAAASVALECGRPDEPCVKNLAVIDGLLERHTKGGGA